MYFRFPVDCPICDPQPLSHCDGAYSRASEVVRLRPGETWTLDWDGLALHLCDAPFEDCPEVMTRRGALRPMPAGVYTVAIDSYRTLPPHCMESVDGARYGCSQSGGVTWWRPYGRCSTDHIDDVDVESVDFTLPESGDVAVLLAID